MKLNNFFNNNGKKQLELHSITPKRLVDSKIDEEGKVTLLKPRFENKFFRKIFSPILSSKYFKIHLDEIGSLVWNNITGDKTGKEISKAIQKKVKGEKLEDINQRIALFLSNLKKNNLIDYDEKK